jgi:DNA-binding NtrC family response regulator
MDYDRPGNVREVQNIVGRALILHRGGPLSFGCMTSTIENEASGLKPRSTETDNLDEIFAFHIKRVLVKTNGKIHGPGEAAELLAMNPITLRNRMNKYGKWKTYNLSWAGKPPNEATI